MPIVDHTLEEVKYDLYACAFNYWLEGWKYRIDKEGYDAVAKDCDASAKEMLDQYEKKLREKWEQNG